VKLNSNVRNVLIIVAIATIVYAVPSGNSAVNFIVTVVSLAFLAAMAWIANRLYREHRIELYSLGTRRRTILYVALGVATLTFSATDRFWLTGFGTIVWLMLLAGCAYAMYAVYRSMQEY
jgi:uncharacterized membrane protein